MDSKWIYLPFCNTKRVWVFYIQLTKYDGRSIFYTGRQPLDFDVPELFNNIDQTVLGLVDDSARVVSPIVVGSDTNMAFEGNQINQSFDKLWDEAQDGSVSELLFDELWMKSGKFLFDFKKENNEKQEEYRLETLIWKLRGKEFNHLGLDVFRFAEFSSKRLTEIRMARIFPRGPKKHRTNFFQLANTAAKLANTAAKLANA
jgi:hypothetical protein